MKINIEIEDLLKVKRQNEVIEERLFYVNEKLKKLSIKEKAYDLRTQEELADVKRLEELGLRSLFKKVLGNLNEEIEKERKEYLAAVLRHKSIEEEIEILEYEKQLLQDRYVSPTLIAKDLSSLTKKKEFLLKSYDTSFSKELFKRESELGRYKLLSHKAVKSIKLADASSKIVLSIKSELVKLLEVNGWPLINKGLHGGMLKKAYIDKARAKAIQANVRLEEFGDSVQKLFREKELAFSMEPFVDFINHFYENLISDYEIKRKLERTLQDLDQILKDVEDNKEFISSEQKKYDQIIAIKQSDLNEYILAYETKKGT